MPRSTKSLKVNTTPENDKILFRNANHSFKHSAKIVFQLSVFNINNVTLAASNDDNRTTVGMFKCFVKMR